MKKLIIAFVIILALSLTIPAFATDAPLYVTDIADILSSDECELLQWKMYELSSTYNFVVRIVTIDTLNGKTAQRYADDYYDEHLLHLTNGNGILLVVSMAEREWAVTTNGETHKVITNSDIDDIMEDVLPDLSAGNYYDAFHSFVYGIELEYQLYESGEEDGELSAVQILLISLAIGAAAGGITIFIMRYSMKTARPQRSATSYIDRDSYRLTQHGDFYLYSRTTRTARPKNNSSGGGGGSRGGRSGRF